MRVDYLVYYENDEEALEAARPILTGKLTCAEIPHCTYANVLMPLVRLGRHAEAEEMFNKGYRMVAKNRDFLPQVTQHLRFLTLSGNNQTGLRLLEKHLSWAIETKHLDHRFHFYCSAWLLLDNLEKSGVETISVRAPESERLFAGGETGDVRRMKAKIETELQNLAEMFDKRNANRHYSEMLGKNRELKKYAFDAVGSGS
jgi:hypothetical protein